VCVDIDKSRAHHKRSSVYMAMTSTGNAPGSQWLAECCDFRARGCDPSARRSGFDRQRTEIPLDVDHLCTSESRRREHIRQPRPGLPRIWGKPERHSSPGLQHPQISRRPATASGQTCIALIAMALSNISGANGKASTEPLRSSTLPR
jgi:hypothetical protein